MAGMKNKIMEYITARSEAGISIRLWMAVLMAVVTLLVNVFYVAPEFDLLPQEVPLLFDMYGDVAEWGHKSNINDYAEIRLAFFVIMSLIACAICKFKGNTLIAKRQRLLIIDIANLVIMTAVGMSLVYIEIAHGDLSQKLSEHWEYLVMFFWIAVFLIEYITDKKHILKKFA